jgi:hypothetical protein
MPNPVDEIYDSAALLKIAGAIMPVSGNTRALSLAFAVADDFEAVRVHETRSRCAQ